jgi:hypothetical protein
VKISQVICEEIQSLLDPNNLISYIPQGYKHGVLDETYTSVNEIKELANEILHRVAEYNYRQYNRDKEFKYIYGLRLTDMDSNKYKEIKDFIEKMNIEISFSPKKEGITDYGNYGRFPAEKKQWFNPHTLRNINVYYNYNDLKNIIDNNIAKYGDLGEYDIYYELYNSMYSSLVHELQHAYDDYQSSGMAYQTKQNQEFINKHYVEDRGIMRSQINDLATLKKYLNLPHEIWARFSQAMIKLRFYTKEYDNQGNVIEYKMSPMKNVLNSFKIHFDNFGVLSDSMKRKLIRKAAQFWQYEKEKIDKLNQEIKNKKNLSVSFAGE